MKDKKGTISKENSLKIRKAIRKKLMFLKQGETVKNEQLLKSLEPVTDPLKKLIKAEQNIKDEIIKKENFKKKKEDEKIDDSEDDSMSVDDNADNIFDTTSLSRYEETPNYLQNYHPLPRQYLEQLISDGSDEFDTKTGIKYDAETSTWSVGRNKVEIDEKDLIIGGIRYSGSPGIYELLFKKNPVGYTKEDGDTYIDILNRCNVLHRDFDGSKQKWGSKSAKYQLIKNLMQRKKSGRDSRTEARRSKSYSGMGHSDPDTYLTVNDKPYNYKYWNSVEELVDRLVMLHGSKNAGNDIHRNEIVAIEEELREANIIV